MSEVFPLNWEMGQAPFTVWQKKAWVREAFGFLPQGRIKFVFASVHHNDLYALVTDSVTANVLMHRDRVYTEYTHARITVLGPDGVSIEPFVVIPDNFYKLEQSQYRDLFQTPTVTVRVFRQPPRLRVLFLILLVHSIALVGCRNVATNYVKFYLPIH